MHPQINSICFWYCSITILLLFISCEGAEFSAPKLELISISPSDVIPRNDTLTIKVGFSDAEGDIDSIYMTKVVKDSPIDSIKDIEYAMPTTRSVRNGFINIMLSNKRGDFQNRTTIMGDLKTPRDYEVSYLIWAVDKKKYKSNIIKTPYVLTKYN